MNKNVANNSNEAFLADWLAGAITDAQLQAMVSETDFRAYQKLRFSMQAFEMKPPDLERNFASVQQKIAGKKNRKGFRLISLIPWAGVAAAILVCIGLYQFFVFSNVVETSYGKTAFLVLKDQSEVTLNAKSKISYPSLFQFHRSLKLEGEAYFKVTKGGAFTVETSQGQVQVLGTQFNVRSFPDYFEVVCFEGKVKVSAPAVTKILTHGQSVRVYKNKAETWETQDVKPSWIFGESNFKRAPLEAVIAQFENQYHCKVDFSKALSAIRFTGSFSHHNIDTALQSICLPMQLHYTKNSGTIIISE